MCSFSGDYAFFFGWPRLCGIYPRSSGVYSSYRKTVCSVPLHSRKVETLSLKIASKRINNTKQFNGIYLLLITDPDACLTSVKSSLIHVDSLSTSLCRRSEGMPVKTKDIYPQLQFHCPWYAFSTAAECESADNRGPMRFAIAGGSQSQHIVILQSPCQVPSPKELFSASAAPTTAQ